MRVQSWRSGEIEIIALLCKWVSKFGCHVCMITPAWLSCETWRRRLAVYFTKVVGLSRADSGEEEVEVVLHVWQSV